MGEPFPDAEMPSIEAKGRRYSLSSDRFLPLLITDLQVALCRIQVRRGQPPCLHHLKDGAVDAVVQPWRD